MNEIFNQYKDVLATIEREDPDWYIDIEHDLYHTINTSDDIGFARCEICETDNTRLSETIFKTKDRIQTVINILENINFKCKLDYCDMMESESLIISWAHVK